MVNTPTYRDPIKKLKSPTKTQILCLPPTPRKWTFNAEFTKKTKKKGDLTSNSKSFLKSFVKNDTFGTVDIKYDRRPPLKIDHFPWFFLACLVVVFWWFWGSLICSSVFFIASKAFRLTNMIEFFFFANRRQLSILRYIDEK